MDVTDRAPRRNALGQPIGWPLDVSLPRPRPDKHVLQGRFVRLEPAYPARHAAGLFDAFSEDREGRIWTYLPYGPFGSVAETANWMRGTCLGEDPMFFVVCDGATGAPAGVLSYLRIDPGNGAIEIGHINFAPRLQRTTGATEALFLVLRHAMDDLGYRRCEWKCDALNAGSRAAAERLGFTFEGVFRQATHYKGRNRDTAWYSITDGEWPALREAFEAWLAPENFGPEGRQRLGLAALRERFSNG